MELHQHGHRLLLWCFVHTSSADVPQPREKLVHILWWLVWLIVQNALYYINSKHIQNIEPKCGRIINHVYFVQHSSFLWVQSRSSTTSPTLFNLLNYFLYANTFYLMPIHNRILLRHVPGNVYHIQIKGYKRRIMAYSRQTF